MRIVLGLIVLLCAACASRPTDGPVLLEDRPMDDRDVMPTLVELPQLRPTAVAAVTSERVSPLQVVTVQADYVIVTPTLPPSKTPTNTPTNTVSPTFSPTPTLPITATATFPTFPTAILTPTINIVSNPIPQICLSQWQYIQPPPQGCPLNPANVNRGVYQEFQRGLMIWLPNAVSDSSGFTGQIYVLYNDGLAPFWTRFGDTFVSGVENDGDRTSEECRGDGLWAPYRGFGKLWRNLTNNPSQSLVRSRLGCSPDDLENTLQGVSLQYRDDGTIFITLVDLNRTYQLTPGGGWQLYAGTLLPLP
ncbi:MAG: hypothetical protein MUF87_20030 [Anaerolineae bacterium]|jgi:hypothetical protein|nr:hypothetical protein [Anaerolineae bacterium]